MKFKNVDIYTQDKIIENGYIIIEDGKISEYGHGEIEDAISLKDHIMIPGFIDQHTHGGYQFRFMKSTQSELETYLSKLPSEGVTSVCLTTVTQNLEKINTSLDRANIPLNHLGAEFLGVHVEGPFINKEKKGAHLEEYIQQPTIEKIQSVVDAGKGSVKIITISAEKLTSELINFLQEHNVRINIGHSNAEYHQVEALHKNGAGCITHLYNAMSGHSHRRPGLVTYALNSDIYAELICDGIHVHPKVVELTYKIKGSDQLILITDSTSCKGEPDGTYSLGSQDIFKVGNKVTLKSGVIAGSALEMIDAFKNIIEYTGCSIDDAVKMTSLNAAKYLGIDKRKGSIAIGKDADLLVLDKNLEIKKTICNGNIVYEV